jgi:hypothetical protein
MGLHSLGRPLRDVASDSPANLDRAWEQRHRRPPDQCIPASSAPAGWTARDVSGCQPRSAITARGGLSQACTAIPRRVSWLEHSPLRREGRHSLSGDAKPCPQRNQRTKRLCCKRSIRFSTSGIAPRPSVSGRPPKCSGTSFPLHDIGERSVRGDPRMGRRTSAVGRYFKRMTAVYVQLGTPDLRLGCYLQIG